MKPKSSAGEDDISYRLIKYCKDEIASPLTDLTKISHNEGVFPSSIKLASLP